MRIAVTHCEGNFKDPCHEQGNTEENAEQYITAEGIGENDKTCNQEDNSIEQV